MTVVAQEDAVATLISILSEGKSAKFASVTYRAKGTGELARHMLVLNFDVETIYQNDIELLSEVLHDVELVKTFAKEHGHTIQNATLALNKTLASLRESLKVGIGHNSAYTHSPEQGDTYVQMDGVKGVRLHKETGVAYILGYTQGKQVIEKGEYKEVNSAPLTRARKDADRMLRRGKIRLFIIRRITRAALNGEVLEIEGEG